MHFMSMYVSVVSLLWYTVTTFFWLRGLLGGHSAALELQQVRGRMLWYNGSLLTLARDLGDRLLPAFNTSSGIPLSRVKYLLTFADFVLLNLNLNCTYEIFV